MSVINGELTIILMCLHFRIIVTCAVLSFVESVQFPQIEALCLCRWQAYSIDSMSTYSRGFLFLLKIYILCCFFSLAFFVLAFNYIVLYNYFVFQPALSVRFSNLVGTYTKTPSINWFTGPHDNLVFFPRFFNNCTINHLLRRVVRRRDGPRRKGFSSPAVVAWE